MRGCLSCAYDANLLFIIAIRVGVDNQQDRDRTHYSDGMPPLLSVYEPIRYDEA